MKKGCLTSLIIAGAVVIILPAIFGIIGLFAAFSLDDEPGILPEESSYFSDTCLYQHSYNSDGICTVCARKVSVGLKYESLDSSYLVVAGIGSCADTKLIIPETHNGKTVAGIKNGAFQNNSTITSVTLPESMYMIGEDAFANCSALTNVTIGASLETEESYYGSSTTIETAAFQNCGALTTLTIHNAIDSIGGYAFEDCTALKNILFTDNGLIYSIENDAFSGCSSLVSLDFPSQLQSIGNYAFMNCTSLKQVHLGSNLSTLGTYAFKNCTALESVEIPRDIQFIDKYPFQGCIHLQSMTLPFMGSGNNSANLSYFFDGNTVPESLTTLNITGGEIIAANAFRDCAGLVTITLPKTLTAIGANAFAGCVGLENVYIRDLRVWCNISFANETATPMCYAKNLYVNDSLLTELPNISGVTAIKPYAFYGCTSLEKAVIPDEVTQISAKAFYGCTGLKDVTVHQNVSSIEQGAFFGCSSMVKITLPFVGSNHGSNNSHFGYIFGATTANDNDRYVPQSLHSVVLTNCRRIYSNAFWQCQNLKHIVINKEVQEINAYAFTNCSELIDITYLGSCRQWTQVVGSGSWINSNSPCLIHCNDGDLNVLGTTPSQTNT